MSNLSKEKEAGKENLPPTPPIREKGQEIENKSSSSSSARTKKPKAKRRSIPFKFKEAPTLEQVKEWARLHVAIYRDPAVAEEFWHSMEAIAWHDKDGQRIRNWRYFMLVWYNNRAMVAAKRDPARFAAPKPVWQQREEKEEKEAAERARRSSELAKRILGRA